MDRTSPHRHAVRTKLSKPRDVFLRPLVLGVTLAASAVGVRPDHSAAFQAQEPEVASITEEIRTLETYPFSEPNPLPMFLRDPRLYPYHSFEGYSATSEPKEWKVVTLENEYIEVFVLPEVGGKVWGAVVKETGHEFIYRNEVMKFRNIALRGPWTSGGIEFNFGVIGHTPSTATPVDYTTVENPDGSVSCWVGSMDLPSRTHWRVEIRLPADRAYFETNVFWYNPTPLEQPYYNWMTAAAFAQDDLEMTMPGNAYLHHSGEAATWPYDDERRFLPRYRNNTFAGHKSYHVVGELNDFFGGYYRNEDYGFGHWARHEDMPGQKLWLWALSPEGGIWEELLTDTDGQYVEFQAGRQFVQYSPGAHVNPITKAGFDPMSSSRWSETWFPVEGIGGLSDASREAALHVDEDRDGFVTVTIHAFRDVQDTMVISRRGDTIAEVPLDLKALQPQRVGVETGLNGGHRIRIPSLDIDYQAYAESRELQRPFERDLQAAPPRPEMAENLFQAKELLKARRYREAKDLFEVVQKAEKWNRDALIGLSEIALRNGDYVLSSVWASWALQLDAYDPKANFLFGTSRRRMGLEADARDALGWAARSMEFRSAAYAQLAEIMIAEGDLSEAARYARSAIDYDRYSIPAWQTLAVIGRIGPDEGLAEEAREELLALDPLHHFVFAERFLEEASTEEASTEEASTEEPANSGPVSRFRARVGGEFPDQTLLEIALRYWNLGLSEDAAAILEARIEGESTPLVHLAWIARLRNDPSLLENPARPDFAFPHRGESGHALVWAARQNSHWTWKWLLALLEIATDRNPQASRIFDEIGDAPDFAPFYITRGQFRADWANIDPEPDFLKALELDPDKRIFHVHLIRHFQNKGDWESAEAAGSEARTRFPGDFNLDLLEVRSLLNLGRAQEAIPILNATHVLPSENARLSHRYWEQAHVMAAMDAYDVGDLGGARDHLAAALEWPSHLGQGRPYEPEERLVHFVLGKVHDALGAQDAARSAFEAVVEATGETGPSPSPLDFLGIEALRALGRNAEAEAAESAAGEALEAPRQALAAGPEPATQDTAGLEGRLIARALGLNR